MSDTQLHFLTESGRSRFGWALTLAFALELGGLITVIMMPTRHPPRIVKPVTMAIHMVKPGPPKTLPLPPRPVHPPKPPATSLPALPKPPPPLPHHPRVAVHHRPPPKPVPLMPRRTVARPTPPQPTPPPTPAPPAPAEMAPPPSPAAIQTAEARYVGIVRGIILGNLTVPSGLRNLGASGTATIAFKVTPGGRILWTRIIRRSAYQSANGAARLAVEQSHFPHFLKKMPDHPIVFEIPIRVSGAG